MFLKASYSCMFGFCVAIGIGPTSLLATTRPSTDPTSTSQIELIYPRYAQVGGDTNGDGGSADGPAIEPNERGLGSGPPVVASTKQTSLIVLKLKEADRICGFIGKEYRISCFAVTYRKLAEEIPANGDYGETRQVLLDTSAKLDNLVRRNVDSQKPALRARLKKDNGRSNPTPPIIAVRSDKTAQLNRQASTIVEEAETVLLRSASSDTKRAIHYQRIAAAVGSNKVLLRSA